MARETSHEHGTCRGPLAPVTVEARACARARACACVEKRELDDASPGCFDCRMVLLLRFRSERALLGRASLRDGRKEIV
jgi:hypothetical protein